MNRFIVLALLLSFTAAAADEGYVRKAIKKHTSEPLSTPLHFEFAPLLIIGPAPEVDDRKCSPRERSVCAASCMVGVSSCVVQLSEGVMTTFCDCQTRIEPKLQACLLHAETEIQ